MRRLGDRRHQPASGNGCDTHRAREAIQQQPGARDAIHRTRDVEVPADPDGVGLLVRGQGKQGALDRQYGPKLRAPARHHVIQARQAVLRDRRLAGQRFILRNDPAVQKGQVEDLEGGRPHQGCSIAPLINIPVVVGPTCGHTECRWPCIHTAFGCPGGSGAPVITL